MQALKEHLSTPPTPPAAKLGQGPSGRALRAGQATCVATDGGQAEAFTATFARHLASVYAPWCRARVYALESSRRDRQAPHPWEANRQYPREDSPEWVRKGRGADETSSGRQEGAVVGGSRPYPRASHTSHTLTGSATTAASSARTQQLPPTPNVEMRKLRHPS